MFVCVHSQTPPTLDPWVRIKTVVNFFILLSWILKKSFFKGSLAELWLQLDLIRSSQTFGFCFTPSLSLPPLLLLTSVFFFFFFFFFFFAALFIFVEDCLRSSMPHPRELEESEVKEKWCVRERRERERSDLKKKKKKKDNREERW